jgi:hypothetical protein
MADRRPLPGVPQRFHDSDRVADELDTLPRPPKLPRELQAAAPPKSHSAADDHVRLGWRGLSIGLPMSLVTALVTALVTHWATPAGLPANDEIRGQVRDIAADVREIRRDLAVERAYTARDIPLLAAVIEEGCSAKFAWHDGLRPQPPDWLPPPLTGGPRWQPALAMLPPPTD